MSKLTFHSGLPERSPMMGARRFHEEEAESHDEMVKNAVLVRSPDDPEKPPRIKGADPGAWRKKVKSGSPEEWARRILEHLSDGVPRTFNRIMVELAGITADVAFQHPPEQGLWLAVERGYLGWTREAPILFKLIRSGGFRKRRGMDQLVPEIGALGSYNVEAPRTKLLLEGKLTAFDVSLEARSKWLSIGGFASLEAAKDAANSWTVATGHTVNVLDRAGKTVYGSKFTREMAKLFTAGWETPRSSRTGGYEDPAPDKPLVRVLLTGDPKLTGVFYYFEPQGSPAAGYRAVVRWDGAEKTTRVPLTSLAPVSGAPASKRPARASAPPRERSPRATAPPALVQKMRKISAYGKSISADELIRQALERYR